MEGTFTTYSFEETQRIGEEFAARSFLVQGNSLSKRKSAFVVGLYGELGSGKTTFAQGLARGLGIKRRIISPTFIIVRKYELLVSSYKLEARSFYHVDLYRVQSEHDIDGLGLKELLEDSKNILAIEWPEKMGDLLPQKRWDIHFEYLTEHQRRIKIQKDRVKTKGVLSDTP